MPLKSVSSQGIPLQEGQVYVCPFATSIKEITPRCKCRIDLVLGENVRGVCDGYSYDMFLTIIEYEGKEYFAIHGFENGGAGINQKPKLKISGKFEGMVGENLNFSASNSIDPNEDQLEFLWDFGDGHNEQGENVSHSYSAPGNYLLTVKADDGLDFSIFTSTVVIKERNEPGGSFAPFQYSLKEDFNAKKELPEEIVKSEKKEIEMEETKILAPSPIQEAFETKKEEGGEKPTNKNIFIAGLIGLLKRNMSLYATYIALITISTISFFKVKKVVFRKKQ